MQGDIVRRRKIFFAWQDEKEEKWLRQMARDEGLHLISVTPPCFYVFREGGRVDHAYRLDFQTVPKGDRAHYLQLFEDAGWEHVGEMNSWHYFRKPVVGGEVPEILTDPDSKAQKYRRVLAAHVIVLSLTTVLITNPIWRRHPYPEIEIIRLLCLLMMVLVMYSTVRLIGRVSELTRQGKRA
jgi:hypothetical protein